MSDDDGRSTTLVGTRRALEPSQESHVGLLVKAYSPGVTDVDDSMLLLSILHLGARPKRLCLLLLLRGRGFRSSGSPHPDSRRSERCEGFTEALKLLLLTACCMLSTLTRCATTRHSWLLHSSTRNLALNPLAASPAMSSRNASTGSPPARPSARWVWRQRAVCLMLAARPTGPVPSPA